MNSANNAQRMDAIVVTASLAELVAFRHLPGDGCSSIVLDARNRGVGTIVNHTLDNGAVVEIGGKRVGPTQDLPAVRHLLGLLGVKDCARYARVTRQSALLEREGGDSTRAIRNTHVLLRSKPTGFVRLAFRLPMYRANLGWLLGHRFLLLTHRGRRTKRARHTVLELLRYDPATRAGSC